jgi:3-oxoacyl-[acyl-carrier-protein] synthase III
VLRSVALACGGYLPERILTNDELARTVDTSDAWISERTGIRQRHIAAEGEATSDLAAAAARDALARADLRPSEVDLLILATSTPDHTFPATATGVQARLGLGRIPAFDVQAVCSGFAYALATADNFLRLGQARTALVIGAETYSRILDWSDRGTCVLFGDGAGAMVLRAEEAHGTPFDRGVLATRLGADGSHYHDLYVDGGPSSTGTSGFVRMNGREVFRHAVHMLADGATAVLDACGYAAADVDWLVPHQANKRIIDAVGRRLGIPDERVLVTVDRHANTSSASIPLALAAAERDNLLRRDQLLVLTAMGGGFTWGAVLLRW